MAGNGSMAADRIRIFARGLTGSLGRVPARFVEDALAGIYTSRSVHLTDMAVALDEDIAVHATHKRLSRNLARLEVRETVTDCLLKIAARRVRKDTRLIVHVRNLHKKYARKMQYLLPEAGLPELDADGYRICEVVACELGASSYTPLIAHLWSPNAPDFTTDCDQIMHTIGRVLRATNGRGVIYHDESIVLHGASVSQLIRVPGLRGILQGNSFLEDTWIYKDQPMRGSELVAITKTPYGLTLYKILNGVELPIICEVGSVTVQHPDFPERPLSLIVIKHNGPYFRDQPTQPTLLLSTEADNCSRKSLTDFLSGSSTTQQVVDSNLAHKERYNLSGFRVLTYDRLQALMTLLEATTFFEAAVERRSAIEDKLVTLEPRPGNHRRAFLVPDSLAG